MNPFQFSYDKNDKVKVWEYGDFLKKIAMYLPESDDKWKFVCGINDLQEKDHPTPQEHAKKLETWEREMDHYLRARQNWNPFEIR